MNHEELTKHLKNRRVGPENWPVLGEDVATFMLWTPRLTGFVQYRPVADKKAFGREGKYYMRGLGPFGWWSLERPGPVYLVEGLFDACRLHALGLPALAALSNDPGRDFVERLRATGRNFIALCDGDSAGAKLAKYAREFRLCPDGEDVSSLTEEELWNIL
jgi:hypothetical protein